MPVSHALLVALGGADACKSAATELGLRLRMASAISEAGFRSLIRLISSGSPTAPLSTLYRSSAR